MKVATKKEVFILGERPTTQLPYGKYNTFFTRNQQFIRKIIRTSPYSQGSNPNTCQHIKNDLDLTEMSDKVC